ncbi:MAG: hypothetical protein ABGW69_01340, partial [Nanoarchaeota archaeon]
KELNNYKIIKIKIKYKDLFYDYSNFNPYQLKKLDKGDFIIISYLSLSNGNEIKSFFNNTKSIKDRTVRVFMNNKYKQLENYLLLEDKETKAKELILRIDNSTFIYYFILPVNANKIDKFGFYLPGIDDYLIFDLNNASSYLLSGIVNKKSESYKPINMVKSDNEFLKLQILKYGIKDIINNEFGKKDIIKVFYVKYKITNLQNKEIDLDFVDIVLSNKKVGLELRPYIIRNYCLLSKEFYNDLKEEYETKCIKNATMLIKKDLCGIDCIKKYDTCIGKPCLIKINSSSHIIEEIYFKVPFDKINEKEFNISFNLGIEKAETKELGGAIWKIPKLENFTFNLKLEN